MKSLGRILIEIWRSVKFELFSTLGSLLTIFLAMILSGTFWIASKNMTRAEAQLKSGMTMDVFLHGELSSDQIARLEKEFLGFSGVSTVKYISPSEALSKMKEKFGAQMLQGLEDENPLPASFVLNVDQTVLLPGAAEVLSKKLSSYPEVEDVVFAGDILVRLGKILRTVEFLSFVLSILVAFATMFIVANTVRAVISDKRKTVEIMQLVGATRGYILTPFVLFGGMLGFFSAVLSITTLNWITKYLSSHLISIIFLETHEILAFVLCGLLLGMAGAMAATQRYLKI
jgi:cell division transport system permease protein